MIDYDNVPWKGVMDQEPENVKQYDAIRKSLIQNATEHDLNYWIWNTQNGIHAVIMSRKFPTSEIRYVWRTAETGFVSSNYDFLTAGHPNSDTGYVDASIKRQGAWGYRIVPKQSYLDNTEVVAQFIDEIGNGLVDIDCLQFMFYYSKYLRDDMIDRGFSINEANRISAFDQICTRYGLAKS